MATQAGYASLTLLKVQCNCENFEVKSSVINRPVQEPLAENNQIITFLNNNHSVLSQTGPTHRKDESTKCLFSVKYPFKDACQSPKDSSLCSLTIVFLCLSFPNIFKEAPGYKFPLLRPTTALLRSPLLLQVTFTDMRPPSLL